MCILLRKINLRCRSLQSVFLTSTKIRRISQSMDILCFLLTSMVINSIQTKRNGLVQRSIARVFLG